MDLHQPKDSLTTSTHQRRKLVKKPPSHNPPPPTPSLYRNDSGAVLDDPSSLLTRTSSQSLKRRPNPAVASDVSSSSPRQSASQQPSSPSLNLPRDDHSPPPLAASRSSDSPPETLAQRASVDFIGAPFDGDAILRRIEAPSTALGPSPAPANCPSIPIHAAPQAVKKHKLRPSASFSTMDPSIVDKTQGGRSPAEPQRSLSKRYSDDGKDSRLLRKKGGLSGLVNSLVGSQKKPTISAPENPVHVTHVGYDSSTGQFTVSRSLPSLSSLSQSPWVRSAHSPFLSRTGLAEGVAASH